MPSTEIDESGRAYSFCSPGLTKGAEKNPLKPFLKHPKLRSEHYHAGIRGRIMTISCLQGGQVIAQLSKGTKTNLEIQKILYFSNMLYIGENGGENPLIDNKFLTWRYGPAVEKLYYAIKECENKHVPLRMFGEIKQIMNEDENPEPGYKGEVEIIKKAYRQFGKYSPYELVRISHWSQGAWRRSKDRGLKEIDNGLILDEFNARCQ